MTTPKISVVTPTFSQAEFLTEAIESVLIQGYPNFEHIIYDGGSNDGTIEILQRYPHLIWVSETDEGQSHALNKALHRATGKIIAWLNSDDWYPPGIFNAIASALSDYPVVMGACQITNRDRSPKELTPNVPHDWYDILKYWIYDSIPCQSSIFFRRDALEQVRRTDGNYFDPDLHYVMDYDLWLRLARLYPFNQRIDKTLSFFRMHSDTKTGGDWTPVFEEASRVFKRYSGKLDQDSFSVVFHSYGPLSSLENALDELSKLPNKDRLEIVIPAGFKNGNINKDWNFVTTEQTSDNKTPNSLASMLSAATRPILCVIEPGTEFQDGFFETLVEIFHDDQIGMIELTRQESDDRLLTPRVNRERSDEVVRRLKHPQQTRNLAIRRVTISDVGIARFASLLTEIPHVLPIMAMFKGWQVLSAPLLTAVPVSERMQPPVLTNLSPAEASFLLELEKELLQNAFAAVRTRHGFGVNLPADLITEARVVREKASTNTF